jgi:hypothetical protein
VTSSVERSSVAVVLSWTKGVSVMGVAASTVSSFGSIVPDDQ